MISDYISAVRKSAVISRRCVKKKKKKMQSKSETKEDVEDMFRETSVFFTRAVKHVQSLFSRLMSELKVEETGKVNFGETSSSRCWSERYGS